MRRNVRLSRALVLVLILGLIMVLTTGCNRTKAPGATMQDTGEQQFMLITLDTTDLAEAEIWVHRLEQNEETGECTVVQTYTPARTENGNTYGLLLDGSGIYEVGANCPGYEPVSHVVLVEEDPVYVLELTPMPVIGETTAP